MIQSMDDPRIGRLYVAGNPIKIVGRPRAKPRRSPPEVDGDRGDILAWLSEPAGSPRRSPDDESQQSGMDLS
jgi:hypothetical protein